MSNEMIQYVSEFFSKQEGNSYSGLVMHLVMDLHYTTDNALEIQAISLKLGLEKHCLPEKPYEPRHTCALPVAPTYR
jgi:hypothetical protein